MINETDKSVLISLVLEGKFEESSRLAKKYGLGNITQLYDILLTVSDQNHLNSLINWLDNSDQEQIGVTEAIALLRYYYKHNSEKLLKCSKCNNAYHFVSNFPDFFKKRDGNAIISVPIYKSNSFLSMLDGVNVGVCYDCCQISYGYKNCFTHEVSKQKGTVELFTKSMRFIDF